MKKFAFLVHPRFCKKSGERVSVNFKSLFEYYGFTEKEAKDYPVITGILKQLTPERVKKEIEAVNAVKLPPDLQKWVKEYEKVGERKEFIWKLFLKINQEINYIYNISKVKSYRECLQEIKFLITMFVVLLDDIVDREQNKKLLNELLRIPFIENYACFSKLNQKEKAYLNFTSKVWRRINQLIKKTLRYKELKEIFIYDIKQIVNAMEHSYLINKNPYLINKTEYWLYSPHTMQFIIGVIVDIMHFSKFNIHELGAVREIIWQALKMARIGNCFNTWEREINDSDFTSGVFAYAISSEVLSPKELINTNNSEIVKKIKKAKIETKLLKEWENCYRKIFKFRKKIKIINIQKFLRSLEKLLALEIINKKYK